MATIKDHRINSVLEKQYNYRLFGILTRREFIDKVKEMGGACYSQKIRNYEKEAKERKWLSDNAFSHPFGNTEHPKTKAYNARKEALKQGLFDTVYTAEITMPGVGDPYRIVITKVEYDYFHKQKKTK